MGGRVLVVRGVGLGRLLMLMVRGWAKGVWGIDLGGRQG